MVNQRNLKTTDPSFNKNLVDAVFCFANWAKANCKLFSALLFFLFFLDAQAQIFVSDSTLVSNNSAVIYSKPEKSSVLQKPQLASVFVVDGAVITGIEEISPAKIMVLKTKAIAKISPEKLLAKAPIKLPETTYPSENQPEKKPQLVYGNSNDSKSGFYHCFTRNFLAVSNHFSYSKNLIHRDFVSPILLADFSKVKFCTALAVVDFQRYTLGDYHNRPPPFSV